MNNYEPRYCKITFGRNVLYGEFDFPEIDESTLRRYDEGWDQGTIDFIVRGGPIVTFPWNSHRGACVDKIEDWDGQ